jgi:glycosyltransferase involved in cell wall biosynthesis
MASRLIIGIPAYNAGRTLERTVDRIPDDIMARTHEIVIVNDGSTDDTADAALRLKDRYGKVTLINQPRNRGYSGTTKTGLQACVDRDADFVVWLHADGQYAPELIGKLLRPLERNEADIVQGSRMKAGGAFAGGMPVYKIIANRALTAIENIVFGMRLAEYHSGYMLYRGEVLRAVPFHRFRERTFVFDQELMVTGHLMGFRVKDVAIHTRYADEESHLKPIRYGFNVLGLVWGYMEGKYNFPEVRAYRQRTAGSSRP